MRHHSLIFGLVVVAFGFGESLIAQESGMRLRNLRPSEVVAILSQPIDVREFREPRPLPEFFEWIRQSLAKRGLSLPIWADEAAFKEDSADAPSVGELSAVCKRCGPYPSLAQALDDVLDGLPGHQATFIVRPGGIEVTTRDRAYPIYRLQCRVSGSFRNRPLGLVLNDLFEMSGVGINVDPRVAHRMGTLTFASFGDPVPLRDALTVVLTPAGLSYVTIGGTLYVTAPEHSLRIFLEHERRRLLQLDPRSSSLGRLLPLADDVISELLRSA
jgi:hypothetical protein